MVDSGNHRPSARFTRSGTGVLTRRGLLGAAAAGGMLFLAACTSKNSALAQSDSAGALASTSSGPVTVSAVSPAKGSLGGGTVVTITGSNLGAVTGVLFGAAVGVGFAAISDTKITVTTPPALDWVVGAADIHLVDAKGKSVDASHRYSFESITPVDAQLAYAFTYWKNYNTAQWGIFTANDCGNFVNQTLVARGWVQSDDWFSNYGKDGGYSLSWVRGTPMFDYLSAHPKVTRYTTNQRENVKVGDVVMFDWDPKDNDGVDHTMLVSQVIPGAGLNGGIAIKCVGHTVDAQYRDVDQAITVEYPGAAAYFFSIA